MTKSGGPHLDRDPQSSRWRAAKFVTSGGLAAGLYFVLSYGLMVLGLPGATVGVLAYLVCFLFGYGLQQRWTFVGRPRHTKALPRYLALQVFCCALSTVALHVTTAVWNAPILLSTVLTTLVLGAVSYVGSSLWVFADE